MQPIATDGAAWSVGSSVRLAISMSLMTMGPAKLAEPIEMPFGMWTRVGPRIYVLDGAPDPPTGRGTFEGMIQDFPTHGRTLFTVALMSGFPRMLWMSVSVGWMQKQSNVTLSFPNEKFACNAASRKSSLTTYYTYSSDCVVLGIV